MGDWLIKLLIAQYVLVTLAYLVQGAFVKSLYWFGVTVINVAWAWMLIGRQL